MRIPRVTSLLLVAIAAGYALQLLLGPRFELALALWPLGPHQVGTLDGQPIAVGFAPWQLVTYAFLHGDATHLLFNGLALYMFGSRIERAFGARRFTAYWFACVLGAALAQLATLAILEPGRMSPTIGASGGVFGLLLAFGMMYPRERIILLFPPIPMPAWLFVTGYGVVELVLGVTGTQSGVAHFAHLGGLVAGFLVLAWWRFLRRAGRGNPR
ncbi:MAG TPA: rhomboid family intramembrane serine protease [Xanthomonadales bacterium]|nr:rhomboid family intramembrane serine protease [Xanthomonadales bacterium]